MLIVRVNLNSITASFRSASDVAAGRSSVEITTGIGLQCLSWAIADYRARARGGSDAAGNKWEPIKRVSIASRILARAAGQEVRRLLRRGSRWRNWNAFVIYKAANDPAWFPEFYSQVSIEFASHEIGVNTGRLVSSLTAGIEGAPKPIAQSINAFWRVMPSSVEFGTLIEYAKYFAAKRPIFFPNMLTAQRKKALGVIVSKILAAKLQQR